MAICTPIKGLGSIVKSKDVNLVKRKTFFYFDTEMSLFSFILK